MSKARPTYRLKEVLEWSTVERYLDGKNVGRLVYFTLATAVTHIRDFPWWDQIPPREKAMRLYLLARSELLFRGKIEVKEPDEGGPRAV